MSPNSMEAVTFYKEWLPLPKNEFRLLVMVSESSPFRGTLADMCRYFSVDPQQRNRNALRTSIESLCGKGLITSTKTGNTYTLQLIPKAEEIRLPSKWVTAVRQTDYSKHSVSWEVVMKAFLWLNTHDTSLVTNTMIAESLNVSSSTVSSALSVLKNDFEAIKKKYVSEKLSENFFIRTGQSIDLAAWWKTD